MAEKTCWITEKMELGMICLMKKYQMEQTSSLIQMTEI
jgi:hypothetical protein